MKYMLLLRHAKSSHADSSLKDFERPLTSRGKKDARRMGKFTNDVALLPDAIISSTAKRAKQTTELFAEGAGLDASIVSWNESLYYGSSQDYMESIQNNEIGGNSIILVGHNPKLEDIARRLCGNGAVRLPPAGLVCFEQPANEWSQIREGLASLKWMMLPQMLAKMED